jgi:uncharacterized protein (DUF342 family)
VQSVPSVDGVININPDDSCHPWLLWIDRNGHADLILLHAMSRGHVSTVDQNEVEKCALQHLREPRVMLARGTQPSILSDGDMGVVAHVHLETQP